MTETTEADVWSWWSDALSGTFGPIHEGHPQQGYYRTRSKDKATGRYGPWEPVAIWLDDGQWRALRGNTVVLAEDIWTWVCRNPVTYEAYEKAREGGGWDDDAPVEVAADGATPADPFIKLQHELEKSSRTADAFLKTKVETQADADKAASWAKALAELRKDAENRRVAEKQPFLDGGRAVDAKWKAITDLADKLTKDLKRHVEPFLIAQKRAEEARAKEAAAKAEALRQEALRLNDTDSRETAMKEAAQAEKEATVQNTSAGRTGSKVSLRVEKTGKVTDYSKAATALLAMKHPDLIALIDQLANRAAKANMPFDGMEIIETEKAV
jgi:hypothetical protein